MRLRTGLGLIGLLFAGAGWGSAAELKPETAQAFDQYIAGVEMKLDARPGHLPFLWSDESAMVKQQVAQGMAVVEPAQGNGTIAVRDGLIQDWRGAVLIPKAKIADVVGILQDYDNHGTYFKPDVIRAKLDSRTGDEFRMHMRVVKSKFLVTDVLDVARTIRYTHVDAKHAYSRAVSTKIQEVSSPGQADEKLLPEGNDRGLLWRMFAYYFFEEGEAGVTMTVESITLTREIPFGLSAIFGPMVRDVPGESLNKHLEQSRAAVLKKMGAR